MLRILIAEDDPMVAELNRCYVDSVAGFEAIGIASLPEEVLNRALAEKPDLILLDIYMPGMTGLKVLEKLRAAGSPADIIMISAANDMGSVQKAMQLGAVDYLIKPFQFERFQQALLAYAQRRHFFSESTDIKQSDIDALLFQTEQTAPPCELPKGLTKETLSIVWNAINETGQSDFSAEDIAFASGVSRVSVRKYLSFLQEAGLLMSDVLYGAVGRPQSRYRVHKSEKDRIFLYI
ncbi:response regulator [Domibacillus iocasae]|uniref:Response regulatory domain-containing protein n=1 Tax=Domibacillus iocasae TaxID=1714016 RepID=A0A1E7DSS9_9BACI|nr:response regulator [Domibacillus iocasae]OES46132.1 hypothetical protein BA724_16245 [Domibacillus iocasae]